MPPMRNLYPTAPARPVGTRLTNALAQQQFATPPWQARLANVRAPVAPTAPRPLPAPALARPPAQPNLARPAAVFDPSQVLQWMQMVADAVRRTIASGMSAFNIQAPPQDQSAGAQQARQVLSNVGALPTQPAKPWWQP